MKGGEDDGDFAYAGVTVPAECYFILIARPQGNQADINSSFAETRKQLNQKVQLWEGYGNARVRSQSAVVDALLGKKGDAIVEFPICPAISGGGQWLKRS